MAISNYTELKTAIEDTINRDDLTTYLDNFIALAEARLARDLKTNELQVSSTLTADARSEDLPDNFAGMIRATFGFQNPMLDYLDPFRFWGQTNPQDVGSPRSYTIEANKIHFAPIPDESMTLNYVYIAKPDIKTDVTNRLLTIYPDIYLWACCAEAARFVRDSEMLAEMEAYYQQSKDSINESDQYKGVLKTFPLGVP